MKIRAEPGCKYAVGDVLWYANCLEIVPDDECWNDFELVRVEKCAGKNEEWTDPSIKDLIRYIVSFVGKKPCSPAEIVVTEDVLFRNTAKTLKAELRKLRHGKKNILASR